MMRVFKYPLKVSDYIEVPMPKGARILSFQAQRNTPCIWAISDPSAPAEMRRFRLAGTGHSITETPEQLHYIDTCQMYDQAVVFHLFEILPVTVKPGGAT